MGLDLAVGLKLDQAGDRSVVDRDQRGRPGGGEGTQGSLRILVVRIPPLGGEQRQCAVEVLALERCQLDLSQG